MKYMLVYGEWGGSETIPYKYIVKEFEKYKLVCFFHKEDLFPSALSPVLTSLS